MTVLSGRDSPGEAGLRPRCGHVVLWDGPSLGDGIGCRAGDVVFSLSLQRYPVCNLTLSNSQFKNPKLSVCP